MGSLKQSYLIRLLRSILVISGLICTTIYGEQTFYHISSTINGNGKVVPLNNIKAKEGNKKKVKFIADTLYELDSVIIDDVNMGTPSEFTFLNIEKDHNIIVWFSPIIPETTVVLTEKYIISKDTITNNSTLINESKDTINIIGVLECLATTLIYKIDSLSDNHIFATIYDTVVSYDSILIKTYHDTLYYKPIISVLKYEKSWSHIDTIEIVKEVVNEIKDTIISNNLMLISNFYKKTTVDSLMDSIIFASDSDTSLIIDTIIIHVNSDTLFYKPFIKIEKNVITLTGRDSVTTIDTSISWNYDTVVSTVVEAFIKDTVITITNTIIDNETISFICDTVIDFWDEIVFEKEDTLKYVKLDDMTSLSYKTDSSFKIKRGLSAAPNPFDINSGDLKIIFNANLSIAKASLIIYDKLGNLIGSLNVYEEDFNNSIIFNWDGYTDDGQPVNTSSVIAVIRVAFLNGTTIKDKVLIGMKR